MTNIILILICFFLGMVVQFLLRHKRHRGHHHKRVLSILINGERGNGMTQIKDDLPATISVEVTDKFGNANGALDGAPVYAISDASFGELVPSEDGMTATFNSNGKLGTFQLTASGTSGGNALSASEDVEVLVGSATSLKIKISQ